MERANMTVLGRAPSINQTFAPVTEGQMSRNRRARRRGLTPPSVAWGGRFSDLNCRRDGGRGRKARCN